MQEEEPRQLPNEINLGDLQQETIAKDYDNFLNWKADISRNKMKNKRDPTKDGWVEPEDAKKPKKFTSEDLYETYYRQNQCYNEVKMKALIETWF